MQQDLLGAPDQTRTRVSDHSASGLLTLARRIIGPAAERRGERRSGLAADSVATPRVGFGQGAFGATAADSHRGSGRAPAESRREFVVGGNPPAPVVPAVDGLEIAAQRDEHIEVRPPVRTLAGPE